LLQDHETFINLGKASTIQIPAGVSSSEVLMYVPLVQAKFDNGKESRSKILATSSLKEGKGIIGGIKGVFKMRTMPLEQKWEALVPFMESLTQDPNSNRVLSIVARRNNSLESSETEASLSSGIEKLQSRGWINDKDALEFARVLKESYAPSESHEVPTFEEQNAIEALRNRAPQSPQLAHFVNYLGEDKLVAMDKLEEVRKEDQMQFALGAQRLVSEQRQKEEESSLLNAVVQAIEEFKPSRRYHNEFPYHTELQGWLRSRFPSSKIEIQTGASRPDIVIEDIAIEVKGPTTNQALDTLTTKCLKYSEYYDKIVMVLFEPEFSESNFREIYAGIERHFPHVRVIRKEETY
jgi:hypothetical protein